METPIWQACQGEQQIKPISGTLYRLVESQEQIATWGYVDTLEEQALLEQMLESVKPPYPNAINGVDRSDYHYLLSTPFRYPPLPWGSRFGRTYQPSVFYGAGSVATTLAESAYYRCVFWFSMDAAPIKSRISTEHTLFSVGYQTGQGVQLQALPFNVYQAELTHPCNYQVCQQLGSAMREAGVLAFEYSSARDPDPERGYCVGLFTPQAFTQTQPASTSQWLCDVSANEVVFKQVGSRELVRFALSDFEAPCVRLVVAPEFNF